MAKDERFEFHAIAIDAPEELSKHRNPWIRQSAAHALARIVSIPTNK
jgi:hypothetical protein